jgi:serine O-acetyltransferase
MITSLPPAELLDYIRKQSGYLFPDSFDLKGKDVEAAFRLAMDKVEHCFSAITHPGYHDEKGNVLFSHLHADHYAHLLYRFSNCLWHRSQNKPLCDKLLLMNRALFTLFISYKNDMPDYFFLAHPFGTILGNASYHDFLVVSHGVTVNTEQDELGNPAPVLGKGLFLGAHAKIIGKQPIGDRVSVGVDAFVYNTAIPDDSVVLCENGNHCLVQPRHKSHCMAQNYFSIDF